MGAVQVDGLLTSPPCGNDRINRLHPSFSSLSPSLIRFSVSFLLSLKNFFLTPFHLSFKFTYVLSHPSSFVVASKVRLFEKEESQSIPLMQECHIYRYIQIFPDEILLPRHGHQSEPTQTAILTMIERERVRERERERRKLCTAKGGVSRRLSFTDAVKNSRTLCDASIADVGTTSDLNM